MSRQLWVPSEKSAWVPGSVMSESSQETTFNTKEGQLIFPARDVASFEPVVLRDVESLFSNLVDLEAYSEGAILHQIRKRYETDLIYTYVGKILVAVNPYQRLDIYGEKLMKSYRKKIVAPTPPLPHVYGIAALAYHNMMTDHQSQSVLISGESGAGKTETTKKVLQYMAFVAGSSSGIETQILQSNPLLEAFGNAKTLRNNNSSRFGKWMQIDFDRAGRVIGCEIENYLLETSRVTTQNPDERSYHIFYMLMAGADAAMRARLQLEDGAEGFTYTNTSGCTTIDKGEHSDDAHEYAELTQAMTDLTFSAADQAQILGVVGGVLHLGNLQFMPGADGDDSSAIANEEELEVAAKLIGCDAELLHQGLTLKKVSITGRSSIVMSPLRVAQAEAARDALSKALYGKLFDKLIVNINSTLKQPGGAVHCGVLDIFGFEVFDINHFEQLCINYANEKLQQHFNSCIFKSEIAMYAAEDVPVDQIKYTDNQKCLDLLEKRHTSIFALLDETLSIPKSTDDTFTKRLHGAFADGAKKNDGHEHYVKNHKRPNAFQVLHFAGAVEYHTAGFLERNRDDLVADLADLCKRSSVPIVLQMFSPDGEGGDSGGGGGGGGGRGGRGGAEKKKSKKTICAKFKEQLGSLMTNLNATLPHFIRCVKPNSKQSKRVWEGPLTLRQLKYAGLFEAIKIRKAGYAFRIPHADFWKRYCVAAPGLDRSKYGEGSWNDACLALLEGVPADSGLQRAEWVVGRTKVFLKSTHGRNILEDLHTAAVLRFIIRIQAFFRDSLSWVRANREMIQRRKAKAEELRKAREEAERVAREEAERRRLQEEAERASREAREAEVRRRKEEEEARLFERRRKIDAAVCLQSWCRGRTARMARSRMEKIKALGIAMRAGDEELLDMQITEALRLRDQSLHGDGFKAEELAATIREAQVLRQRLEQKRLLKTALVRATETENVRELRKGLRDLETTFADFSQLMPEAVAAREKLAQLNRKVAAQKKLMMLVRMDTVEVGDELEAALAEAKACGVGVGPQSAEGGGGGGGGFDDGEGEGGGGGGKRSGMARANEMALLQDAQRALEMARPKMLSRNRLREAVERADREGIVAAETEVATLIRDSNRAFATPELRAAKMMRRMFQFERDLKAAPDRPIPDGAIELCEQIESCTSTREADGLDASLRGLLGDDQAMYDCVRRTYKWIRTFARWKGQGGASAASGGHMETQHASAGGGGASGRGQSGRGRSDSAESSASTVTAEARGRSGTVARKPGARATAIPAAARVRSAPGAAARVDERRAVLGDVQYKRLLESEKRLAAQRKAVSRTTNRLQSSSKKHAWSPS